MSRYRYRIQAATDAFAPLAHRTYPSAEAALRAFREAYGRRAVYRSEWFRDDAGMACALYDSKRARDTDDTAAHVPWLVRLTVRDSSEEDSDHA